MSTPSQTATVLLTQSIMTPGFHDAINNIIANREWDDITSDQFLAVSFLHGANKNIIVPGAEDDELMMRLCRFDPVMSAYAENMVIDSEILPDYFHGRSLMKMFELLIHNSDNIVELALTCYDYEELLDFVESASQRPDICDVHDITFFINNVILTDNQKMSLVGNL